VKGKEAVQEHLQRIGQTIHALLQELQPAYHTETAYQVLERLFADNFHLNENGLRAKENSELTSDSLQSVDDLEATYRTTPALPLRFAAGIIMAGGARECCQRAGRLMQSVTADVSYAGVGFR
jgi:hypothetical protein